MRLCMAVRLKCSVCGLPHGSQDEDIALFGAVAACPCCGQVAPDHKAPEYHKRAEEYTDGDEA